MSDRTNKVAEGLRRQISIILEQKVKDPVVGVAIIKDVDISPDLRNARVNYFIRTGSEEGEKKVYRHLRRASSFIRKELAKDMSLKYVPRLTFSEDRGMQEKAKLEELYEQVRKKEDTDEK